MSQFARVAAAILAGFVALALIVHLVFVHDQMLVGARAFVGSVVDRTLALRAVLQNAPPTERQRVVGASSGPGFRVAIESQPPQLKTRRWPHADELAEEVQRHLEGAAKDDVVVDFYDDRGGRGPTVRIAIPLGPDGTPDGSATGFLVVTADGQGLASVRPAAWGIVMALVVLMLVLWGAKRSTRHLPRFAAAAEALGRNVNGASLLPVTGPKEVRRAAAAFNDMTNRVRSSLRERTDMLAAVSHDLRTLLTKLALRLEYIDDVQHRERARDDVVQMTTLIDSVLTFAREDNGEESVVRLDLATLLVTLTDDERALGRSASYTGVDHLIIDGRAVALRRAFANLIDNALRYGNVADVTLASAAAEVVIDIADRGPGIPAAQRARVLLPFQRLEPSRNRETGGTGLGLAIASAVISRHGGELVLLDRPGGGLIVRVTLKIGGEIK